MTPEVAVLALRDLEYIIAIAEYRSFSLAARSCSVSQPALSGQIRKVEQSLNVQLFERTNRSVIVTPVGQSIVEQCRTVIDEVERIGSLARGAEQPLAGLFRLGVIETLAPYFLPEIVSPIRKSYPNLDLVIRESTSSELYESLRTGKLDAIIAPEIQSSGTFGYTSLGKEPLKLLLGSKHLEFKKRRPSLKKLSSANLVLLDSCHLLSRQTFQILNFEESSTPPLYTTSIESICCMVSGSSRYAVVPELASRHLKAGRSYKLFDFPQVKASREIYLVWRGRYSGAKAVEVFGELLKELFKKSLK